MAEVSAAGARQAGPVGHASTTRSPLGWGLSGTVCRPAATIARSRDSRMERIHSAPVDLTQPHRPARGLYRWNRYLVNGPKRGRRVDLGQTPTPPRWLCLHRSP